MSSAGYDCIDMFDLCLLQPVFEFAHMFSDDPVVIARDNVEKEQILIDLLRLHQRVVKLIGKRLGNHAGTEGTDPTKITQVHAPGLDGLAPTIDRPAMASS